MSRARLAVLTAATLFVVACAASSTTEPARRLPTRSLHDGTPTDSDTTQHKGGYINPGG